MLGDAIASKKPILRPHKITLEQFCASQYLDGCFIKCQTQTEHSSPTLLVFDHHIRWVLISLLFLSKMLEFLGDFSWISLGFLSHPLEALQIKLTLFLPDALKFSPAQYEALRSLLNHGLNFYQTLPLTKS